MIQYIVYGGGASGYGLYEAHPNFPEEYRESVENLYVRQRIVGPTNSKVESRCYRFAPLKDRFLFSVIYKECVCEAEKRPFFSTVNWLLTAAEADAFLNDAQYNFSWYVQQSDEILANMGYTVPSLPLVLSDDFDHITDNAERAMLTAAFYSMQAAYNTHGELSAQVFVGCAQGEILFTPLFCLYNYIPTPMRKYISFHIGAVSAEETKGVSLALTYDELFELMAAKGNYSGAMAVKKIVLVKDRFSAFSAPALAADAYFDFGENERRRLARLFLRSDNFEGFWRYIAAVSQGDTEKTRGASLALMLGEAGFSAAVANDVFSEDELLKMYDEKELLFTELRLLNVLEKRVKPILDRYYQSGKTPPSTARDTEPLGESELKIVKEEAVPSKKRGRAPKTRTEERAPQQKADDGVAKEQRNTRAKHGKNVLSAVLQLVLPYVYIATAWLLLVALGVGAFLLGVWGLTVLSPQALVVVHGIQIALLLLLGVPLGYFAIFITQYHLSGQKDKRKKRKEKRDEN